MSVRTIHAVDLFCGAGGTSTGLAKACTLLGLDLKLLAINHWNVAIDTHSTNHPKAKHLCESADNVDPRKVVPGGRLHILVASPECKHHSNARGGRPMSDQSRASAWHVLRWAEALYIENIIVENVREFRTWGPLGANGRPIKRLRGQLYIQFLNSLRALGYNVEERILNAADFGDPTTRERLFIICRRGKPVAWPEPRYAPLQRTDGSLISRPLRPWRTAREIIDWSLPGQSIFARKRPLAEKTIQRIVAGLKRFGGPNAEPFLVVLRNHSAGRSIDEPVPTVTASGQHIGLCEPFVLGQQSGGAPRSVEEPLPTVAAKGAIAVVDPFLVAVNHGEDPAPRGGNARRTRSVDEPLPTVTTKRNVGLVEPFIIGHPRPDNKTSIDSVDKPLRTVTASSSDFALVEPFILPHTYGSENQVRSVDEPLNTVTGSRDGGALVEPFVVPFFGEREGQDPRTHSIDEPLPAVTSHGAGALVEPFITAYHNDGSDRCKPITEPLPTQDTSNRFALVEPYLVKYNGTADARPVSEPLDTVTARDRFALVTTEAGQFYVDIRFRMLQPHELARAQGFSDSYEFKGTREDVVKQIGNAVPVSLAAALCSAVLEDHATKKANQRQAVVA